MPILHPETDPGQEVDCGEVSGEDVATPHVGTVPFYQKEQSMSSTAVESIESLIDNPEPAKSAVVTHPKSASAPAREGHSLYIKAIPVEVWERARINAIRSNMAFRDYIIVLLQESKPVSSNGSTKEAPAVSPGDPAPPPQIGAHGPAS